MTEHIVELDDCELEIATAVAAFRVKRVIREGLGRGHGETGVGFEDRHLPGAIGEIALAKLLRLYWAGNMDDFGVFGDVGTYEVRGSWYPNAHAFVYQSDVGKKDPLVVLVTISGRVCTVRGCVRASVALSNPQYQELGTKLTRRGSAPVWAVPQSDLGSL